MQPDTRIKQALQVCETGSMVQFDKGSAFAQALRDLLKEVQELRKQELDIKSQPDTDS